MKLAMYIKFNNNAEDAFKFYKEVFDAEEICFYKYSKEMTNDENKIGTVFHAEMCIKDSLYLYMSDALVDYNTDGYKIVLEVHTLDEANGYFDQLKVNGSVISEMKKMPYGPTIGELKDQFGTIWNIVAC